MDKPNGLYPKIARIMGRLNRLPKTGRNAHFKYDFVTDADVADAVRKELATENVAFFASMIEATQEGKHTVATFQFIFACGDTGDTQTCMWVGEANDSQDKGLTKAATSAEKYFLLKTFMLSAGDSADDPDSSAEQPQSVPEPSELDGITWTRNDTAQDDFTRLRNKASVHWQDENKVPMVYSHVYKRIAIIIGSDKRPQKFNEFADMMRDDCELERDNVWQGVVAYVPQSDKFEANES